MSEWSEQMDNHFFKPGMNTWVKLSGLSFCTQTIFHIPLILRVGHSWNVSCLQDITEEDEQNGKRSSLQFANFANLPFISGLFSQEKTDSLYF